MNTNYTNYEDNELVRMYQKEEREEIFQEIMQRAVGIIYNLALKYQKTIANIDLDDLVSEGNIVLWKSIKAYKVDGDCKFSSFLYSCLQQRYNSLYKRENAEKRKFWGYMISFDQMDDTECEEGATLGDRFFSVECEEYSMAEIRMVIDAIPLSEQERVVVNFLIEGKTKSEIAHILNVKTPSVHSYCKRIGNKFREYGVVA